MQARIGGMDGIFVAYHNTKQLFGFQYLPMSVPSSCDHIGDDLADTDRSEIDERLFGSSAMGTQAFHLVVSLFDALISHCADAFPGQVSLSKQPTDPMVDRLRRFR